MCAVINRRCGSVLAVDLGTSSVKVYLYSSDGTRLAQSVQAYPTVKKSGGYVEQSPQKWIESVVLGIRNVAESCNGYWPPTMCSITGQMHGVVLLDANGSPLRRAIICSDSRASAQVNMIAQTVGPKHILEVTGNPALSIFPAAKLLWIKDNENQTFKHARHVLFPKDYVGYVMTGELLTEPSDASGSMLYDLDKGKWDTRICAAVGVSEEQLPQIKDSTCLRGKVTKAFAGISGIPEGTPVLMGGGDLSTTMLGMGITTEDSVGISLGTAGIVLRGMSKIGRDELGTRFFFSNLFDKSFISLASLPAAGLSVNWFWSLMEGEAYDGKPRNFPVVTSPGGQPTVYYLPFIAGTGTPYMNYNAKGAFMGLGPEHSAQDLKQAIFEGICFSLKQSYQLALSSGPARRVFVCGGGSYSSPWVAILANVLGRSIEIVNHRDTACLGAAMLGGFACGWYTDLEDAMTLFGQTTEVIVPDEHLVPYYEKGYERYLEFAYNTNGLY